MIDVELSRERAALDKADLDIRGGEGRIRRQQDIVANLRASGRDTAEAERLLDLLRRTLAQWRDHRRLMLHRIAHLEARVVDTGDPEPG